MSLETDSVVEKKSDATINNWRNNDNVYFYNNISMDTLPEFALRGGLSTGCDIDLIMPFIKKSGSILEIGAAYGRVISHLINKDYKGKIVALERAHRYCALLRSQFFNKAEIVQADLKYYNIENNFDAILFLWTGICEFEKNEQLSILKKLSDKLNPGGVLILDSVLPTMIALNAINTVDQYIEISDSNDCRMYVYIPSPEEIENYAKALNLELIVIPYKTTTERDRVIYILKNPFKLSEKS